MVFSKTRTHDLRNVKQLNCWGSELTDVSLVRQMPFVQVLSLSVNCITTLADFGACKNLQELYLRDNQIANLNQILYLVDLPNLKKLWLAGNPCADRPNYRMTVIKNLPYLEALDNISVTRDEVIQAESLGSDLSLDDSQPSAVGGHVKPSHHPSSTSTHPPTQPQHHQKEVVVEKGNNEEEDDDDDEEEYETEESVLPQTQQQIVRGTSVQSSSPVTPQSQPQSHAHVTPVQTSTNNSLPSSASGGRSQRASYPSEAVLPQTRPPPAHLVTPVQSSASTVVQPTNMVRSSSTAEYVGYSESTVSSHYQHAQYGNGKVFAGESGTPCRSSLCLQQKLHAKGGKNRNANILSAVLCLIKELDAASLEVVDTEIHCRMEDFNN